MTQSQKNCGQSLLFTMMRASAEEHEVLRIESMKGNLVRAFVHFSAPGSEFRL
jgi:hypothetical protein